VQGRVGCDLPDEGIEWHEPPITLDLRVPAAACVNLDDQRLHQAACEHCVSVYFCDEDALVPDDDGWQDKLGTEINNVAAYSRELSRNFRKGLDWKLASGRHIGGVAFGYCRDVEGRIVPTRRRHRFEHSP